MDVGEAMLRVRDVEEDSVEEVSIGVLLAGLLRIRRVQ